MTQCDSCRKEIDCFIPLCNSCAHGLVNAPFVHPNNYWLIYFDDADLKPMVFTKEESARMAYANYSVNWSCHLFKGMESNSAQSV